MKAGRHSSLFGDLLKSLADAVSDAFIVTKKPPDTCIVEIKSADLLREDAELLNRLFSYVITRGQPEITVRISHPLLPVREITSYSLADKSISVDSIIKLFDGNYILHNSVLFVGLVSALQANHFSVDTAAWAYRLRNEMIAELKTETKKPLLEQHFKRNVIYLYQLSGDIYMLRNNLRYLLPLLIRENKVKVLLSELHEDILKNSIYSVDGDPYSLLHEAVKKGQKESIDLLLKLMDGKPKELYDGHGNSLMHHCRKSEYFEKFLAFLPDINHPNQDGNTALHMAAMQGNLDKVRFLLAHGADPEIKNHKGETCFTIPSQKQNDSLNLYRAYKLQGTVLNIPPRLVEQKGLTCGFYAIACAAGHHRHAHAEMFKKPYLPARKKDQEPKAVISLRQLRKKHGIAGRGSIFSVTELVNVIEETECKSMVYDIRDYSEFMAVIKKAIELNLPVIIPFSLHSEMEGMPSKKLTSDTAHWATVIGYVRDGDQDKVLTAQYEKFFDTRADELFTAFFDIEETTRERVIQKKYGLEWAFADKSSEQGLPDEKTEIVPMTSLHDFRRKLVVVLPPEFDVALLHGGKKPSL